MFSMRQRLAAELFGTFWLVLGGCGTAVLAGSIVKNEGVALAFGLTVVTMAYAVGHISGGHFNPAVTIGLATARRFDWREVPAYVVTQIVGAIIAAAVLFVIASGIDGFNAGESGFATNGYGDHSPGGYSLLAVLVCEIVLTAFFLYVILGVTDTQAPKGFAPLAIGLALTLIHLISIPVSNTSVNPATVDRAGPVRRRGRPGPAVGVPGRAAGRRAHRRGVVRRALRGTLGQAPLEVATEG